MFQISNRVVKVQKFNEWIDTTMQDERRGRNNETVVLGSSVGEQWNNMCDVLRKYMDDVDPTHGGFVHTVDQWLSQQQCKQIKLEMEQNEHRSLISNIEETISKFSNVCTVLKKHMAERKRESNDIHVHQQCAVQRVDQWFTRRKHNEMKLNKENEEYKKMVNHVEKGMSELDSKINTFTHCLGSIDIKTQNKHQPEQQQQQEEDADNSTPRKITLDEIESNIRSFNEEDAEFQIKDFAEWLVKMKLKLKDLEENMEVERKVRCSKEKQHAMEREILNYLFNQKQKEISILKEKVSNKVLTLSEIKPVHLGRVEG